MTDPDAPSRDDPEWSEICHWIATDVKLNKSHTAEDELKGLQEVMPYKPPGPPPKTGKHRYVFVALAPLNGTTEKLHLTKPGDRQHWGFRKERQGLRMWAEEMGLGVVGESLWLLRCMPPIRQCVQVGTALTHAGANFIYEQNDKQ